MKAIGILGGTFDPPHNGHLMIADEVRHACQLDEVWFIPTNEPPHKQQAMSNNDHRKSMLEKALSHTPYFRLCPIEMERSGKSYTIDTIKLLKQRYPKTLFYFIIGADMVEYLPNWYKIDELMKLVKFVGVKRPHYSMQTEYPILSVEVPALDISSDNIKKRIKNAEPFQYFIPHNVYHYIKDERLYE